MGLFLLPGNDWGCAVDVEQVVRTVSAALAAGAAAVARDGASSAAGVATRLLREAVARSLGGDLADESGDLADESMATSPGDATDVLRERLRTRLPALPEADLHELLHRARAVLVATGTQPTPPDRYGTSGPPSAVGPVAAEPTGATRRLQISGQGPDGRIVDPVGMLTARAVPAAPGGGTEGDELTRPGEPAVDDPGRPAGVEPPDDAAARAALALAHQSPERGAELVNLLSQSLAKAERLLGAEHPDTLAARIDLAHAYRSAGRRDAAIETLARVVADRERVLGADHPETLLARTVLESWYGS